MSTRNKSKTLFQWLAAALAAASLNAPAYAAADDISVILDGEPMEFDVPPQIVNERTMVPMRAIFEALGATVEWVPDAQLVLASYDTKIMAMEIGAETFTVTDIVTGKTSVLTLDAPAFIEDERTLVPIRAVSESMGRSVTWDGDTRTVTIE